MVYTELNLFDQNMNQVHRVHKENHQQKTFRLKPHPETLLIPVFFSIKNRIFKDLLQKLSIYSSKIGNTSLRKIHGRRDGTVSREESLAAHSRRTNRTNGGRRDSVRCYPKKNHFSRDERSRFNEETCLQNGSTHHDISRCVSGGPVLESVENVGKTSPISVDNDLINNNNTVNTRPVVVKNGIIMNETTMMSENDNCWSTPLKLNNLNKGLGKFDLPFIPGRLGFDDRSGSGIDPCQPSAGKVKIKKLQNCPLNSKILQSHSSPLLVGDGLGR